MLFYKGEETKLQPGDIASISEEGIITIVRPSKVVGGDMITFSFSGEGKDSKYYIGDMNIHPKKFWELFALIAVISGLRYKAREDFNHENNRDVQFFEFF